MIDELLIETNGNTGDIRVWHKGSEILGIETIDIHINAINGICSLGVESLENIELQEDLTVTIHMRIKGKLRS